MNTSSDTKKRLPRVCIGLYLFGAVSLLLYLSFFISTEFADRFNNTVGFGVRFVLAKITGWIPFSFAEMLILLIPLFVGLLIALAVRAYADTTHNAFVYVGILASALVLILSVFVWGFAPGYRTNTVDRKLGLEQKEITAQELYATAEILSGEIRVAAEDVTFAGGSISVMPYSYREMNDKLLDAYEKASQKYDFIHTFRSNVKPVMLSKPLSYTHITGFYTFFTGEANINVNFPDYTIPYTTAHELAHQRGFAREDEANFIAFLVCSESDDPYIRYSGYLSVYEYVISALACADYDAFRISYLRLPENVRAEESAYSIFYDLYRENIAASVSGATNDFYLKSQGASAGTNSYNMVVDLTVSYYRSEFD